MEPTALLPHLKSNLILLALLIPIATHAATVTIVPHGTGQSIAFARYMESIQDRDPFTESGPILVVIEASAPDLYKEGRMIATRQASQSERPAYQIVGMEGDAIVMHEVVANYLKTAEQMEEMPFSSVAITPVNYKFRYMGEVGAGDTSAYVFRIVPRRKCDGLMRGELWIDARTGQEVLRKGRLVKTPPSFAGKFEVLRDTTLLDGSPSFRVSHVILETRQIGRGELTITELPLAAVESVIVESPDRTPLE
jgi:hypothetical protein